MTRFGTSCTSCRYPRTHKGRTESTVNTINSLRRFRAPERASYRRPSSLRITIMVTVLARSFCSQKARAKRLTSCQRDFSLPSFCRSLIFFVPQVRICPLARSLLSTAHFELMPATSQSPSLYFSVECLSTADAIGSG